MTPDDLARDLDEFSADRDLLGDDEAPPELVEAPLNQEQAFVLYRRLRRLEGELGGIQAAADAEVARVKLWQADRSAGLRARADTVRVAIEAWQRATKTTTSKTPWGTSRLTPPRSHVEVIDAEAFVRWARDEGYWGLLKSEPMKGVVGAMEPGPAVEGEDLEQLCKTLEMDVTAKVLITESGEKAPGVLLVTPVEPSFTVTVS